MYGKDFFRKHKSFKGGDVSIDSPLSDHIAYLHQYITGKPFEEQAPVKLKRNEVTCKLEPLPEHYDDEKVDKSLNRVIHGTQDMARVAALVKCVSEVYRLLGDSVALRISPRQMTLLQITGAWHDAMRKDDDKDYWDKRSAIALYHYLTQTLALTHEEAASYAELIFNKDENRHHKLILRQSGKITFKKTRHKKRLFTKVLHDADCLDIIRARPFFDGTFLDLYKRYVQPKNWQTEQVPTEKDLTSSGSNVLTLIGLLRNEVSSLIEYAGDAWQRLDYDRKYQYECAQAYQYVEKDIHRDHHQLLPVLYNKNQLLDVDNISLEQLLPPVKESLEDEDDLQTWMYQGRLLARGILTPSCLIIKPRRDGKQEDAIGLELRKMLRRTGIPTSSHKADRDQKDGSPQRSCSLIGFAGGTFAAAGGLIKLTNITMLDSIAQNDSGTGFGKTKVYKSAGTDLVLERERVFNKLKLGGSGLVDRGYTDAHTEAIGRLKGFDAIYFTHDPTHCDLHFHPVNNGGGFHKHSAAIQALYIRQAYQLKTGIALPVYEYSAKHGFLAQRDFADETIQNMMVEACVDYMQRSLRDPHGNSFATMHLDELKTVAIYGTTENRYNQFNPIYGDIQSPDRYFNPELIKTINKKVCKARQSILSDYHPLRFEKDTSAQIEFNSLAVVKGVYSKPTLNKKQRTWLQNQCRDRLAALNLSKSKQAAVYFQRLISTIRAWLDMHLELGIFDCYRVLGKNTADYLIGASKFMPSLNAMLFKTELFTLFFIARQLQFKPIIRSVSHAWLKYAKQYFRKIDGCFEGGQINHDPFVYLLFNHLLWPHKRFTREKYQLVVRQFEEILDKHDSDERHWLKFDELKMIYFIIFDAMHEISTQMRDQFFKTVRPDSGSINNVISVAIRYHYPDKWIKDLIYRCFSAKFFDDGEGTVYDFKNMGKMHIPGLAENGLDERYIDKHISGFLRLLSYCDRYQLFDDLDFFRDFILAQKRPFELRENEVCDTLDLLSIHHRAHQFSEQQRAIVDEFIPVLIVSTIQSCHHFNKVFNQDELKQLCGDTLSQKLAYFCDDAFEDVSGVCHDSSDDSSEFDESSIEFSSGECEAEFEYGAGDDTARSMGNILSILVSSIKAVEQDGGLFLHSKDSISLILTLLQASLRKANQISQPLHQDSNRFYNLTYDYRAVYKAQRILRKYGKNPPVSETRLPEYVGKTHALAVSSPSPGRHDMFSVNRRAIIKKNLVTGEKVPFFENIHADITCLAPFAQAKPLLIATADGMVSLALSNGTIATRFDCETAHGITAMAVSNDKAFFACLTIDKKLYIHDISKKIPVQRLDMGVQLNHASHAKIVYQGNKLMLAWQKSGQVVIFDVEDNNVVRLIGQKKEKKTNRFWSIGLNRIKDYTFSFDGELVGILKGKEVELYRTVDGQMLETISVPYATKILISPAAELIIMSQGGTYTWPLCHPDTADGRDKLTSLISRPN